MSLFLSDENHFAMIRNLCDFPRYPASSAWVTNLEKRSGKGVSHASPNL